MISLECQGQRIYLLGNTFPHKERIKSELHLDGKNFDSERRAWWVGAGKRDQAEKLVQELNSAPAPASTVGDDTRVLAKVGYKGRNYYVIAESGTRARLTVLDGSISFWADKANCNLLKEYHPREERGAYGKTTGRLVYQTLGSIKNFIDKQKQARESGAPVCSACGVAGGELVEDMEDGLLKHRRCCDMAP
jgi:hypothetical protein